jgi:hypothetical protein
MSSYATIAKLSPRVLAGLLGLALLRSILPDQQSSLSSWSHLHDIDYMAAIIGAGNSSSGDDVPSGGAALAGQRRRRNKIVILGPHDRYNFGDLLFEKVIAKLLHTRAGYHDDDILRGGLVSVNMSQFGGSEKVISMKTIQHMSRTDTLQGPYDIVYSGGEALGCSHECGVGMLPRELRQQARDDKVYDCAYLFPKELLLSLPPRTNATTFSATGGATGVEAATPKITRHLLKEQPGEQQRGEQQQQQQQRPKNYAIVNSMGGQRPSQACKKAMDTSDYVAYRDHDPLAPDSAVMTKELFGDVVDQTAHDVMKELLQQVQGGGGITITEEPPTSYIAVQHKVAGLNVTKLARALDQISKNCGNNTTIVFFAAGTVAAHDSFEKYAEVQALMTQPSIVYQGEHVWKVVALISRAQAVLSTSLHVRIMSFIFHRPRVTWCTGYKHGKFIELWDAPDASHCVEKVEQTWQTLQNYMEGANPGTINQDQTKEAYRKAVHLYLDSFDKWSGMIQL